jgi:hypothetical protein
MSLFDKLCGRSAARETERTIRAAEQRTSEVYGPLSDLTQAITVAADSAQRQLQPVLGVQPSATPSEPQILTLYEFFYFYLHLTVRSAVGAGFSASQVRKLQAFTGPMMASTAVDAFFRHWPDDKRRKMSNEFFQRLNDAEVEYAKCRGDMGDNPLDDSTLFGRFARNVASLWDCGDDLAVRTAVLAASTEALVATKLKERLTAVAATIDEVDLGDINAFWSAEA